MKGAEVYKAFLSVSKARHSNPIASFGEGENIIIITVSPCPLSLLRFGRAMPEHMPVGSNCVC